MAPKSAFTIRLLILGRNIPNGGEAPLNKALGPSFRNVLTKQSHDPLNLELGAVCMRTLIVSNLCHGTSVLAAKSF